MCILFIFMPFLYFFSLFRILSQNVIHLLENFNYRPSKTSIRTSIINYLLTSILIPFHEEHFHCKMLNVHLLCTPAIRHLVDQLHWNTLRFFSYQHPFMSKNMIENWKLFTYIENFKEILIKILHLIINTCY